MGTTYAHTSNAPEGRKSYRGNINLFGDKNDSGRRRRMQRNGIFQHVVKRPVNAATFARERNNGFVARIIAALFFYYLRKTYTGSVPRACRRDSGSNSCRRPRRSGTKCRPESTGPPAGLKRPVWACRTTRCPFACRTPNIPSTDELRANKTYKY